MFAALVVVSDDAGSEGTRASAGELGDVADLSCATTDGSGGLPGGGEALARAADAASAPAEEEDAADLLSSCSRLRLRVLRLDEEDDEELECLLRSELDDLPLEPLRFLDDLLLERRPLLLLPRSVPLPLPLPLPCLRSCMRSSRSTRSKRFVSSHVCAWVTSPCICAGNKSEEQVTSSAADLCHLSE